MTRSSRPRLVAALAVLALIALVAAGCGGGGTATSTTSTTAATSARAVDAAFVDDMIPHHQSAIAMATVAQTKAEHPQVRALATAIIAAQTAEIAHMKGLQPGMSMHGGHMGMSAKQMGMDGDMSMLKHAKPFDKAFIDMMIPHHQGAILMARKQLADGQMPALHTMARAIIKAQAAEIAQMQAWRNQWYGSGSTDGTSTTGTSDSMPMGG